MSSSSSSSGSSGASLSINNNNNNNNISIPNIIGLDSPSDHLVSEQLCYVHCNFCDTVLAVSVPCSSMFKTVTVRCGHCTNLLSVNMRALLLPTSPAAAAPFPTTNNHNHHQQQQQQQQQQLHLGPTSFFSSPHTLLEEIRNSTPNLLINNHHHHHQPMFNEPMMPIRGVVDHLHDIPKPPPINRPPEKRQRVPSAYNRFIKDEIQRIKAGNPDISHREAFSAAAKNWAHFPHIHFGLMPDHQPVKKANVRQQQQEGDQHEILMKEGFLPPPTNVNVGVGPY